MVYRKERSLMNLVHWTSRVLTTPCIEFDFASGIDPSKLAHDMVDFMYEKQGLGLSANQVGLPWRVFVMRGHPENFACFNPRIVDASEERVTLAEGCLSYPGMVVPIKRPRNVRVRFQTPDSDTQTRRFTDMTARVFQHELDHLDGLLFYNLTDRYHRDAALRRFRLSQKRRR